LKKYFLNIGWNATTSIITFIVNFITLYVFVRHIDKIAFGEFAIGFASINLFKVFLDFGSETNFYTRKETKSSDLANLSLFFILNGFFLWVIFCLSCYIFLSFTNDLSNVLIWFGFGSFLIFEGIGLGQKQLLIKNSQFKLISKVEILSIICASFVSIYLAINGYNLIVLLVFVLLKSLIENLCWYLLSELSPSPISSFKTEKLIPFFKRNYFDISVRFIQILIQKLDTFIIGFFLGSYTLGVYDVLKNIASKIQSIIPTIVTEVSFPEMIKTKEQKNEVSRVYAEQLPLIFFIGSPLIITLYSYSVIIIEWYLGEVWLVYNNLFKVLLLYFLFRMFATPVGGFLKSTGRIRQLFYWNLFNVLIISIVLLISANQSLYHVGSGLLIMQLAYTVLIHLYLLPKYLNRSIIIRSLIISLSFVIVSGLTIHLTNKLIKAESILSMVGLFILSVVIYCIISLWVIDKYYDGEI